MTVSMAIIGAGRIGMVHAQTLAYRIPEARVVAVADVIPDAAATLASRLQIPAFTADYHELLARPDIDAVAICSATNTHAQIIIESAAAGKHIFCEKPIDFSPIHIREALAAVDRAGVKLQIGFNRRFDASFARVRTAIASGEIGDPHIIHIVSRDPSPPPITYVRVSGGMFMDMSIHDFDMARFLTGCEPVRVFASASVKIDPAIGEAGDVDSAFMVWQFENDITVTIDNSRQAVYGYDQRVEAFGSRGAVQMENVFPNTVTLSTADQIKRDLPLNFFMQRYTQSYEDEMRQFITAVSTGSAVPVTGKDGLIPALMALAARKSVLERRPVAMSEVID